MYYFQREGKIPDNIFTKYDSVVYYPTLCVSYIEAVHSVCLNLLPLQPVPLYISIFMSSAFYIIILSTKNTNSPVEWIGFMDSFLFILEKLITFLVSVVGYQRQ